MRDLDDLVAEIAKEYRSDATWVMNVRTVRWLRWWTALPRWKQWIVRAMWWRKP